MEPVTRAPCPAKSTFPGPRWADAGIPQLQPGDIVLAMDGQGAEQAVADAQSLVSGANPGHHRYRALELLASGNEEEERHLLVRRGEGAPFQVTLRCSVPAFGGESPRRNRPAKVAELAPGVFYIDLDRIQDQDLEAALPRLEKARGVVFDLRGYPANISPLRVIGRLLHRPVASCSAVPLVTRPEQPGRAVRICRTLKPDASRLSAKVVFLIDERAMSLAESLLQIVAENHLATLVGSPTAGTGGEINEMVLPGGYQALWTGTFALNADGTVFWGQGHRPALAIRPTLAGIRAGRDEVLEAGLSLLR